MAGFSETFMEHSKESINDLMQWMDPFSILVITEQGKLKRIYCPFSVMVITPVGYFKEGDIVAVEAVKITLELKDVFIIAGKAYYIFHFRIIF